MVLRPKRVRTGRYLARVQYEISDAIVVVGLEFQYNKNQQVSII
jgi:hypothetical protein